MRVVFMGTPQLAATILEALSTAHEVVGAFTRPDAVRGRGKKLVGSPVRLMAESLGIATYTPKTLRDETAVNLVRSLEPDVICVAAYGAILPPEILEIPPNGCLNVHTSLLPRWRGAAPIERAILARDEMTGVCIMRMEEGLDTGAYCVRKEVPVGDRYLAELASELAVAGSEGLLEALEQVEAGSVCWTEQAGEGLTYASKIAKGELDFTAGEQVNQIVAKVRASNDSHPSRTSVEGRMVAVERARIADELLLGDAMPRLKAGEATFAMKRLVIAAEDGLVELEQVKPEGKKSMEGRAFAAGVQGLKNNTVAWGRA